MNTNISEMMNKIEASPEGTAFIISDFTDSIGYETAKKTLARLEKKGVLRRVLRGVYDKPAYSNLLQEVAAPDPEQIAEALARSYNWTIAPSGNTALNLLGLSTQVPANWVFISSGPYKKYEFGSVKLEFLHRADKTIAGMSQTTAMVIEALKAIGRENVTEEHIKRLKRRLPAEAKELLIEEGRHTSHWIYDRFKEICKEEEK